MRAASKATGGTPVTTERLFPRLKPLRLDEDGWLDLCREIVTLLRSAGLEHLPMRPIIEVDHEPRQPAMLPISYASRQVLATCGVGHEQLVQVLTEDFPQEFFDRLEASADDNWPLAACDIAVTASSWLPKTELASDSLELSLSLPLGRMIDALVRLRLDEAQASTAEPATLAVSKRLGMDGTTMTLEEAGAFARMTRERVRQIEAQVQEPRRLLRRPIPVLTLAGVIASLDERTTDPAAILMAANGGAPFGPDAFVSLLKLADLSASDLHPQAERLTPAFAIQTARETAFLTRAVLSAARGAKTKLGFVMVANVAENVEGPTSAVECEVVLAKAEYWTVLPSGWAYFEQNSRHFLRGALARMFGCSEVIPIDDIHGALMRYVTYRRIEDPPPTAVLRELFEAHPAFTIDDQDMVRQVISSDLDRSTVEFQIADLILASPSKALHRNEIIEQLTANDVRGDTIRLFFQYSPLLKRCGSGVYTVVGNDVMPATVHDVRTRTRALLVKGGCTFSPEPSGVALTITISSTTFSTGVITPRTAARTLIGDLRYEVVDASGAHVSTANLASDGTVLVGLGRVFEYFDLEPGDCFTMHFDRSTKRCVVEADGT